MIPELYEEYTQYMLIQRILCLEKQLKDKMTPRDEFAKAALNGLTSDSTYDAPAKMYATLSYVFADEMLKAREVAHGD